MGYGGYPAQGYGGYPAQGFGGYPAQPQPMYGAQAAGPMGIPAVQPVQPGMPAMAPATPLSPTAFPQPAAGTPAVGLLSAQPLAGLGITFMQQTTPEQDCQALHTAMHGAGTDENTIINICCSRTNDQRAHIRKIYASCFGTDLIKRLKSELSGNFEDVIIGLFMNHAEYDAYCLYKAMKGLGTNEGVLIEIIGTRNNYELTEIKRVFQQEYGKTLEKWIESETSGNFRKILIACLQCQRSTNTTPNPNQCQMDAQQLYQAGEGRLGTDEATFIRIFSQRSPAELAMISQYYSQLRGKTLLQAVDKEFSKDTKKMLQTIINGQTDPASYFATRIREAVQGIGTNDSRLVRVIVSRCEVDLPAIKAAYNRIYGRDLLTDVRNDTSGDYKKVLTYLISRV